MKHDLEFLTVHDCIVKPVAKTEVLDDIFDGDFEEDFLPVACARASYGNQNKTGVDEEADIRLMESLARNKHTGPFEHLSCTLLLEAPIFVIREWHRHRTQSYSEISMRYVTKPARRFFIPDQWRASKDPTGNKQGSGAPLPSNDQAQATDIYEEACGYSYECYTSLLELDCAKEQARALLPVGMISTMFVTANLLNWYRFWRLRIHPSAMYEIRVYAARVNNILQDIYPVAWNTLTKHME